MRNETLRKSLSIVRAGLKQLPKSYEKELSTGWTFFEGRDRLLKLMDTGSSKNGFIHMELNVLPSKHLQEVDGLTLINHGRAKKKKLGTVKAVYKGADKDLVVELIKDAINNFKDQDYRKIWPI